MLCPAERAVAWLHKEDDARNPSVRLSMAFRSGWFGSYEEYVLCRRHHGL